MTSMMPIQLSGSDATHPIVLVSFSGIRVQILKLSKSQKLCHVFLELECHYSPKSVHTTGFYEP